MPARSLRRDPADLIRHGTAAIPLCSGGEAELRQDGARRRGAAGDDYRTPSTSSFTRVSTTTPELSEIFIDQLGLPSRAHRLDIGSGSHARADGPRDGAARAGRGRDPTRPRIRAGDVNSTLAAALVLAKLGVPYAHVESGLRSFDRSMPEEINRIVADEFADLLFAHSEDAVENLRREGIEPERIHLVGNTMIDTLCRLEPLLSRASCRRPARAPGGAIRAGHAASARRSSTAPLLDPGARAAPGGRRARAGRLSGASAHAGRIASPERYPDIRFLAPLGYLEFLSLEADAAAVLTDSGGVQEETTFLGVPCFTLRTVDRAARDDSRRDERDARPRSGTHPRDRRRARRP